MPMRYQEFPASRRLQKWVECFWSTRPGKALPEYPVLPDGCVDIVYSPGVAGDLQLVGTMTQARRFALPANQFQFGVRFRPGMSTAILPLPGLETTDQSIAMEEIWGARSQRVAERIAEAQSEIECIRAFE